MTVSRTNQNTSCIESLQQHTQRSDDPPWDIIVKPHYYKTKELVMQKSRKASALSHLGHDIHVFDVIFPFISQKCRALKSLLTVLTRKAIKHRWAFPLCLSFTYASRRRQHFFSTFDGSSSVSSSSAGLDHPGGPVYPLPPLFGNSRPPWSYRYLLMVECSSLPSIPLVTGKFRAIFGYPFEISLELRLFFFVLVFFSYFCNS